MNSIQTFTTVSQFPASAGVEPFNASYSNDFAPEVLAFVVTTNVFILFYDFLRVFPTDPVASACSNGDCVSYFISGGWDSVAPYLPLITSSPKADVFIVESEPGLQGDYWNVSLAEDPVTPDHCQTWGVESAAIMICVKTSSLDENNLIAGTVSVYKHLHQGCPFVRS